MNRTRQWPLVGVAVLCLVATLSGVGLGILADDPDPLAEAGLDQTVVENETVYLDAGGSSAPNGSIASYEWSIRAPDGTTVEPACPDCVRTSFVPTQVGRYAVTVTVTDEAGRTDEDTLYVTVESYDRPEATLTGPDTVALGTEATFTLTASAGQEQLTDAGWRVNGTQRFTTGLSDHSATVERNLTFTEPGIREVSVVVSDALGYQTRVTETVQVVPDGPFLAVDIDNTSAPVEEGQPLTVEATVTNIGNASISDRIWLTRENTTVALSPQVSLAPGNSEAVTLTWQTNPGDAGYHTLEAHTVNDTAATNVTVDPSTGIVDDPYFDIGFGAKPPDIVQPGEVVQPAVVVHNIGDGPGTQTIVLEDIHGRPVASTNVTLGPGESRNLTDFSWTPTDDDVGTGNLTAVSADDSATASLQIARPAYFDVEIQWTKPTLENLAANDGDVIVAVSVTNTGDLEDTQTLDFDGKNALADNSLVNISEQSVTLEAGEQRNLTFIWENVDSSFNCSVNRNCGLADTNVTVASEDDNDETALFDGSGNGGRGDDPTRQTKIVISAPDTLYPGKDYNMSATVVNTISGDTHRIDLSKQSIIISINGAHYSSYYNQIKVDKDVNGVFGKICITIQSTAGEETLTNYPRGEEHKAPVAYPGYLSCDSIEVEGDDDGGDPF